MSSFQNFLNLAEQVPNWAPNEHFLPNADYGRVGALKLASNLFTAKIGDYCTTSGASSWAKAGAYHFYLLGKNHEKLGNEKTRAELNAAPTEGIFNFGSFNIDEERDGPFHFKRVLEEINEAARIYGFSPSVLASAVLTHIHGYITHNLYSGLIPVMNGRYIDGAYMAKYNFGLIEALWGVRGSGYPRTMRGKIAARKDYKGRKNGGRSKRRRRF